jgi:hypothetical protein
VSRGFAKFSRANGAAGRELSLTWAGQEHIFGARSMVPRVDPFH